MRWSRDESHDVIKLVAIYIMFVVGILGMYFHITLMTSFSLSTMLLLGMPYPPKPKPPEPKPTAAETLRDEASFLADLSLHVGPNRAMLLRLRSSRLAAIYSQLPAIDKASNLVLSAANNYYEEPNPDTKQRLDQAIQMWRASWNL